MAKSVKFCDCLYTAHFQYYLDFFEFQGSTPFIISKNHAIKA
jgi:hypothetical protein